MAKGTGASARFRAIQEVNTRVPRKFDTPKDSDGKPLKVSEYFGQNTFSIYRMREKLPRETYEKILSTIESGKKLDPQIANVVAQAVKDWAMSQGVTHFCHWFQPQTGLTAEKHDAFLSFDEQKRPVEKFSGSQLIQSEPDASSFPSGGMRTTFEARGYTAWDPSSPMFIIESTNGKTLCIPSAFISYYGDALDEKTALLRSMEVLSQKSCELLALLGEAQVKRVIPTLGTEQEYFLIDRAFYSLRPDLVMSARTLLGGQPPKGQQLEDHYFGSIPSRVQAFMSEVEHELYKLGVPVKTRHNEVAPSQYESAPIFEDCDIAIDHNQLTMEILRKVARRHSYEVLLHEKPFAGLNGSGKHCNWSMAITASGSGLDGTNLLEPGKTPHQNVRFLAFLVAVLKGVHQYSGPLRAGIASSGNDHRLGANEAPPAIISVFLGEQLNRVLNEIEKGIESAGSPEEALLKLGVSKLPEVSKDNTDRNRTSPFAFTGNKFEFRAVGSSASPAFPMMILNTAVADGIRELTEALQKKMKISKNQKGGVQTALLEVLKEMIKDTKVIRFEGNNYSDEWVKEADRRGLPNLRKTPESLSELVTKEAKNLLVGLGVLTEGELVSRFHVRLERYIKNILIEVDTLRSMVDTQILPACYAYHSDLVRAVSAAKSVGAAAPQMETANKLASLISGLQSRKTALDSLTHKIEGISGEEKKADFLCNQVSASMQDLRSVCDELEGLVADDYWPLPKYREMLFLA